MAFGELCRSARTGCWGLNDPETSMGGFHKFRFEEMRSISLLLRRVRLRARCTALSGALFLDNGSLDFLERRDGSKGRNQRDGRYNVHCCDISLFAHAMRIPAATSSTRSSGTTTRSARACSGLSREPPLVAIAPYGMVLC